VVPVLAEYLEWVSKGGSEPLRYIDKFIVGRVMAFWGAHPPPNERHAPPIACAAPCARMPYAFSPTAGCSGVVAERRCKIRIGINTAAMLVGNMVRASFEI